MANVDSSDALKLTLLSVVHLPTLATVLRARLVIFRIHVTTIAVLGEWLLRYSSC